MSFVLPRLIWLALNPLTILLVLICLALFMQVTVWRRSGRRLLFFCATILVLLSVLPIGQLMLAALEGQYPPLHRPPARVDGIILLGGAGPSPTLPLPPWPAATRRQSWSIPAAGGACGKQCSARPTWWRNC